MSSPVITRSFLLDGRFWEISFCELFVEIATGKVGASGRVKEHVFASREERDRFVASNIEKALKKGFLECDPNHLWSPEVSDPWLKQIETLSRKLCRPAFMPKTVEGEGENAQASRFGGRPWLSTEAAWPDCGRCLLPMHFVFQLRRNDMPRVWRRVFRHELVQLFLCDRECQSDYGWEPFAPSTCVRSVRLPRSLRADSSLPDPAPVDTYTARALCGWEEGPDYPSHDELSSLVGPELDAFEVSDAFKNRNENPLIGDKLGGWAAWIQGAIYPQCRCGATMTVFFQIESNRTLDLWFGDVGAGWVMACPACHDMTFVWQSH